MTTPRPTAMADALRKAGISEEAIAAGFSEGALAEADRIAARLSDVRDCPRCQGNGLIVHQRVHGFTDPEAIEDPCPDCGGTGLRWSA